MSTTSSIKGCAVNVATFSVDGDTFVEVWESRLDAENSMKEWMLERSITEELKAQIETLGIYEAYGFFVEETGGWFEIETHTIG